MTAAVAATSGDVEAIRLLAVEVEDLFGAPMGTDPGWVAGLRRNVDAGNVWCVRHDGGVVGATVLADRGEHLHIGWLTVSSRARRQGAGRALVERAIAEAVGRPVEVVTFGVDHPHPGSAAARALYEACGMRAVGPWSGEAPDGTSRVVYRLG